MTLYAYTGRDQSGHERKGVMDAEDERSLRDAMRRRGILVVHTRPESAVRTGRLKVPVEERTDTD